MVLTTNGQSTLNGAINASVTSLVVTSAASLPTAGNFRIKVDNEIMMVTGVSSNTLTVTRGIEGTTGASHADLAVVTEVLTAAGLLQIIAENANVIGASGNTGQSALASNFTLASATTVFDDIGVSVALPAAGYYKLTATVTAQMACSSGTFVVGAKMRNDTDNADIGVVRNVGYVDSSVALLMPGATWVRFVTVAAPKTIKLYVERVFNGTVTTSLLNGATEDTTLTFERLS